ncbi:MAG: hypothetical protein ACTSRI_13280 [Promethearchaeota archaeon]
MASPSDLPIARAEGTLSPKLHTKSLPTMHVWVAIIGHFDISF